MKKLQKPQVKIYVGENLSRLRRELGLSLDDVAYNTGISKAYLSQVENGQSKRPSVQIAYILAKAFEAPFEIFCVNPINRKMLDKQG